MVTLQERHLLQALHAHQPFWMSTPAEWVWHGPNGPQGFGMLGVPRTDRPAQPSEVPYCNFGLMNLLWLSMDMARPPQHYDARLNSLYIMLTTSARSMRVDGTLIIEQASTLTLRQFHDLLAGEPKFTSTSGQNILPLLRLLAFRRLKEGA